MSDEDIQKLALDRARSFATRRDVGGTGRKDHPRRRQGGTLGASWSATTPTSSSACAEVAGESYTPRVLPELSRTRSAGASGNRFFGGMISAQRVPRWSRGKTGTHFG